jgi:7,8-dihydropterin-6-yl-methyl-4-(beta-D-ribofuranosyl)aminobenzene 5'-phosphate synthase
MEIKILYDNEALPGFEKGWGFSCLIELNDSKILFDTGDGPKFLSNLAKFAIAPTEINNVVLSHPHHDHLGGIGHFLEINPNATVFTPSFFPVKLKMQLMSMGGFHETFGHERIMENVHVDLAMNHLYEQFCVIETSLGLLVITGCAHPGIDRILNIAAGYGKPIYGLLGGFHGFRKLGVLRDLSFIAPCHCTAQKANILAKFPETAKQCGSGMVFQFEA